MSLMVRSADLEQDCDLIIDLHSKFLTPFSNKNRFNWLYLDNPAGLSRAWVIHDSKPDKAIGVAAAFPRCLLKNEEKIWGWVLGDFCIDDQYRTLGPALLLQKACLEGIRTSNGNFYYDFPSVEMLAVYKRLRMVSDLSLNRFAIPLRVNQKVQAWVKSRILSQGISYIGNRLLRYQYAHRVKSGEISFSLHAGECEREFTELADMVGGEWGPCIYRSASYLNWRYLNNPLHAYGIITARKREELIAYLIWNQTKQHAMIVDLFGIPDFSMLQTLIQWAINEMIKVEIFTVSIFLSDSHPMVSMVKGLGFKARESSPVIWAESEENSYDSPIKISKKQWCFMYGDRDV